MTLKEASDVTDHCSFWNVSTSNVAEMGNLDWGPLISIPKLSRRVDYVQTIALAVTLLAPLIYTVKGLFIHWSAIQSTKGDSPRRRLFGPLPSLIVSAMISVRTSSTTEFKYHPNE